MALLRNKDSSQNEIDGPLVMKTYLEMISLQINIQWSVDNNATNERKKKAWIKPEKNANCRKQTLAITKKIHLIEK